MAIVSNGGTVSAPETNMAEAPDMPGAPGSSEVLETEIAGGTVPATLSKWYRLRQDGTALVKYLLDSEVHTFAFSVAANAILSFIPFIVLLYTLSLKVFHSPAMADVVSSLVLNFFPTTATTRFWGVLEGIVPRHVQVVSIVMILISCTGIFLPLEVALNQAWGVTKSRNYLLNQVVAFGLAIWMVILGMITIVLSATQKQILSTFFFHNTGSWIYEGVSSAWLIFSTGVACILFFFSIYWLLPNCKVPARPVLRASIVTGVIWMAAKYVFVLVLPHLDLRSLYGPFFVSVDLLFWAYVSGLILFAGAQFSVARLGIREK